MFDLSSREALCAGVIDVIRTGVVEGQTGSPLMAQREVAGLVGILDERKMRLRVYVDAIAVRAVWMKLDSADAVACARGTHN